MLDEYEVRVHVDKERANVWRVNDAGPTQAKRLATNIFRAASRMRELWADLNSVARGNRPTAEIGDVGAIIAAASDAASATTKNHNVQILLEVSKRIELPLIRSRMERVFFNLIANALEAMPTGGMLRIVGRKAGNCVLIELEDTGPGIPPTIRDRLFEPFTTAGKQDGLGLGLALARQTVRNRGDDLWLEPATGARFVIRLPLKEALSSLPGTVRGIEADLGTAEGAAKLIQEVQETDILMNNLGIYVPKEFSQISDEEWLRVFEINVLSAIRLARHYFPVMLKLNRGRVIFISSESSMMTPSEMVH
jgi:hypothetical protein